jgi:hypothetical protein
VSRINSARLQIACSVDLLPFFDSARWRRLIRIMFLRFNRRRKDGKERRYWNIVGPFNRAFRARFGMRPTDCRRAKTAEPRPQTRTDS